MANEIEKVNAIAVADIQAIIGKTDDDMEKLMGKEFTGVTDGMVLIQEQTASNAASLTFATGIDDTYDMFMFQFVNIHAHTGDSSSSNFTFQVNDTGTTGYDDWNLHSSFAAAFHDEDDSGAGHGYDDNRDSPTDPGASLTTDYVILQSYQGTEADEACSGEMYVFNLSDDSYSKPWHSIMTTNAHYDATYTAETRGVIAYKSGGASTPIDDFNFKISTGNMSGTIRLWGWVIA